MGFESIAPQETPSQTQEFLHYAEKALESEGTKEVVEELDSFFHENNFRQGTFDEIVSLIERNPNLLLRREAPDKVLSLVSQEQEKISLNQDAHDGMPYPNAAISGKDAQGMITPLTAGFESLGDGRIVLLTGFAPTEKIYQKLFSTESFAHYQKQIPYMRAVEGEYSIDNLAFVMVRFVNQTKENIQFGEEQVWHGEDLVDEFGFDKKDLGENQFNYCFYVPRRDQLT